MIIFFIGLLFVECSGVDFFLTLVYDLEQVLAVLVLEHRFCDFAHTFFGNPSVAVGDSFEAGDFESLALLDDFDEGGCFGEGVVGAGVKPGKASAECLDFEFFVAQEPLVYCGYLQFATCGGLDGLGYVHHLVGVEVETDYGIVALGVLRLFFYAEAVALAVEFCHSVALGVADPIAEDGGLVVFFGCADGFAEEAGESVAVEDVVAKYEAGGVVPYEFLAYDEGLCESVRRGLLGILKVHTIIGAVSEESFEAGEVVWGGDDEYIPDTRQHECADGVIDHRFVVDGQKLLAYAFGDGIESGAGASGEDYAFHICCCFLVREWRFKVFEERVFGILVAQNRLIDRDAPVDAETAVQDADASVCLWGVEVIAFVLEDCCLAEDGKAVGEAFRHEELTVVVFGEFHGNVLAVGGAALADVNRHIEHLALDASDELALGVGRSLEVEPAHHSV